MAAKRPRPLAPALVFVQGDERYVHIEFEGLMMRLFDDVPELERSAADIIEAHIRAYRSEVAPHIQEIARLSRLALDLRKKERPPQLP